MVNDSKRKFLKQGVVAASALMFSRAAAEENLSAAYPAIDPTKKIPIGVLFSLSGVMQIYGWDSLRVSLLAIDDINRSGGIHGAMLAPIIRDGASHWPTYTKHTLELLAQNVNIFWGCVTSASREAILPAIQRAGAQLFYGVLYEGRECSPNMIATGPVPNQLTEVSIPWMMELAGKKVYIIGSNYIYPHTMSKQARINIYQHGGKIFGDEFFSLDRGDATDFTDVVKDIIKEKPDWILSNLVGVNPGAFLKAFKYAGLSAEKIPILHSALIETQIAGMGNAYAEGHYSSVNYYQSIDTPENREFVKHVKSFSSPLLKDAKSEVTLSAITEGVYLSAMVSAKAMRIANSAHPDAVREAARGMKIKAPSGDIVKIDKRNLHTWLRPRIGKATADGNFDIVYESPKLVRPEVFNPAMDAHRTCIDGGHFYIRGNRVQIPKVTRTIFPQAD